MATVFFNHLDRPLRLVGLTLDEAWVAILMLAALVACEHRLLTTTLALSVLAVLRRIKGGEGPRVLLRWAYWHLPALVTMVFLSALPKSCHRHWQG